MVTISLSCRVSEIFAVDYEICTVSYVTLTISSLDTTVDKN